MTDASSCCPPVDDGAGGGVGVPSAVPLLSTAATIGGTCAGSCSFMAGRGGVTGAEDAACAPPPMPVKGITAGADVLRLGSPLFARVSTEEVVRAAEEWSPFFLLALRSSLCLRRNSARSALEMPSSTSVPVVLPGFGI